MRLGHIPSLHIYPAARPPAACRAVICASLWPDPADEICPPAFRTAAVAAIKAFAARVCPGRITAEEKQLKETASPDSLARWEAIAAGTLTLDPTELTDMPMLRMCLLDFIADFANWDNSALSAYLETARTLTKAAHEALGGEPGTRPVVVDPFAGGGAIPLEALRVGADAFASDLNPVSVLINKVILEYIPRYGKRLADEVEKWGKWAQEQAKIRLADYYPKDPDGAIPIAYLWARTITCEGPGCGAEVPLMRSFWLARKGGGVALIVTPDSSKKELTFSIVEKPKPSEIQGATVARGSVTCPCCGYTTPASSTRTQLKKKRGGSSDAKMFVVVTAKDSERGRTFRLATNADQEAYSRAAERLAVLRRAWSEPLPLVPEEPTPKGGGRGAGRAFSQRNYGMDRWEDIYNRRQLLALTTYVSLAREYVSRIDDQDYAKACNASIALIIDRLADLNAALCVWQLNTPNTAHVFGRWALQLTWDYGEVNPLAGAGGSPESAIGRMVRCISYLAAAQMQAGQIEQASADMHPLPDDSASAFVTDPPYYDAVPYSDLLDFFYVWLKRSLGDEFRNLVSNELGPKKEECIVDEVKGKDNVYYEKTMQDAMTEARRVLHPGGVGVVVFAHKSTSGWEAQLQAMVNAGLTITASWPIDTEMGSRLRAKGSAALASSVHLVCRPRENSNGMVTDSVGDWRDVLSELPKRMHEWMPRLASEGVVGADAIFACLGPALEIFSRYSSVEKTNGDPVLLKEFLEHVWAAVSKEALSTIFRDADASGLEPDARLTAMWLWTLGGGSGIANGNGKANDGAVSEVQDSAEPEASAEDDADAEEAGAKKGAKVSGFVLEFDAARKIAQGLGVHLEKSESIVEVAGDKARLLPVAERTRYLFGQEANNGAATSGKKKKATQKTLFDALDEAEAAEAGWTDLKGPPPGSTVLDRVHQAMILFAAGRGELMKRFLVDDGVGQDTRFWKLAQSLSALYPTGSDEKRWVDGVLARKKGLGM